MKVVYSILASCCAIFLSLNLIAQIEPKFETDAVLNWNAADDPAIWLHPEFADSSFIVGTDKSSSQGRLELYNMDGTRYWWTDTGTGYNNVDVMYNYIVGEDTIDIVGACNKPNTSLDFFRVDPITRTLIDITGNTNVNMSDMYGFTMYNDMCNDIFYAYLNRRTTDGKCYQYELINTDEGLIDIQLVRILTDLPTRTEGMVADPVLGDFYVSEESVGIWKYGSRPEDGLDRVLMDAVTGPNLTALVEGLCIYYTGDSTGYLIASSQGADNFQVYRREGDNEYLGTFSIGDNTDSGIDGVQHADGIDVMNYPMGDDFPYGVFVTHDLTNADGSSSNYKLVPWESIADQLELDINIDLDPRLLAFGLCDTLITDTTIVDTTNVDTTNFILNFNLKKIKVYPNPVQTRLYFESIPDDFKGKDLVVYNSIGKAIIREKLKNGNIDVSTLSKGLYVIKIEEYTVTFIKE